MKQLIRLLPLVMLSAAFNSADAQTTQRLSATKANDYAIVYSLPNTQLNVTLEAEISVKKPGEFYKYAKKYLNIDDPITKESHSAQLKSVTVTTEGIANPDERYAVQFKSGSIVTMTLNSNGVPLSINIESPVSVNSVTLAKARAASPTALESPAARQVVSEEMAQSQSVAKKAELAAAQLFDIRQTRNDLITGQAEQTPPDGKSLQLMLDNLEDQEQALMAMFVGTTSTYTVVKTINEMPDDNIKDLVIARISPLDGIIDADDLAGDPVTLNVEVLQRGEMPTNDKGETLSFPKNGLAYSIPGSARVTVSFRGETHYSGNVDFAQMGTVYGLSPNAFIDKKDPIYVIFDPATGAITAQGTAN